MPLAPESSGAGLRDRLVSRYRQTIGGTSSSDSLRAGRSSITVQPDPSRGPGAVRRDSLGSLSSRSGLPRDATYGQLTATSARLGGGRLRSPSLLEPYPSTAASRSLYASRLGEPGSGVSLTSNRLSGSGSVLYWGTTAFGSRAVVGTYLRVPLSGGVASAHYAHYSYHGGGSRSYRPHYWSGYYGGCYPGYYAGYRYGRPYSGFYGGFHVGLGLGWGIGWSSGYWGCYDPWWPQLGLYSSWYNPYYARTRYVYTDWPYYSWGYPYGGTTIVRQHHYYYYDSDTYERVEPPPASAPADSGVVPVGDTSGGAPAAPGAVDQEAFLDSLNPAELAFVTGVVSFRGGEYEQAAQAWYAATLKSPESVPPRMLLATGLFALGEFQRAAEYLGDALARQPEFARYAWDLRRMYGKTHATGLERHMKVLDSYLELYPNQVEGHVVRGFILHALQDRQGAAQAFDAALSIESGNAVALAFAAVLRAGAQPEPVFDETQTFLNTLALDDVKRLNL